MVIRRSRSGNSKVYSTKILRSIEENGYLRSLDDLLEEGREGGKEKARKDDRVRVTVTELKSACTGTRENVIRLIEQEARARRPDVIRTRKVDARKKN